MGCPGFLEVLAPPKGTAWPRAPLCCGPAAGGGGRCFWGGAVQLGAPCSPTPSPLSTFSPAVVEADNTVTLIIVGVVGGLIGLLILFMLVKRVVLFIIKKTQDGK